MTTDDYRFDIAFSFLAEDEPLAQELSDALQDRLEVFIYSKKQEELAGTDGEETFNRVFGCEARTVAVLYRENWGETPWTRIEKTAIRNRAFEKGYDFVTFIPLEKPALMPEWLPKTRIWLDLERWGVKGATVVLERKAQEAGATPRTETAVQLAQRIQRQDERERRKQSILQSPKGFALARDDLKILFTRLDELAEEISSAFNPAEPRIDGGEHGEEIFIDPAKLEIRKEHKTDRARQFCLAQPYRLDSSDPYHLAVTWSQQWANSLQNSKLSVMIWRGTPYRKLVIEAVEESTFRYDLDAAETGGWREDAGKQRFLSSAQLADEYMKLLIAQAHSKAT